LVSSSKTIGSQGSIGYGGGLTLKYATDFENVVKTDEHRLSLPIDNWFEFQGEGGARMWIEGLDRITPGITPHSGSRCIGMELTDITKSSRNEFNILGLNSLVGQEIFVSVCLYLPADWGLFDPGWNWYEIANPMFSYGPSYLPYWAVHIVKPPSYCIDIDTRGLDGQIVTMVETPLGSVVQDPQNPYPLPIGKWFNLQYYVLRSSGSGVADGAVKVWIDGKVVCDLSGVVTKGGADWFTTVAKIYGSLVQSAMPYRIWVDNLSIYGAP
jgi:hypothetical protein